MVSEEPTMVTDSNYSKFASHCSETNLLDKMAKNRGLGKSFLRKLFALWYSFRSPDTPAWAKAVIIGALGYFICPVDATPDFIPGVGYVDDAAVIASALAAVGSNINDEVEDKAEKAVDDLLG